jgi:DivIVA domain-containing protein
MTDEPVVLPKDGSRPGTPWWIRGTTFAVVDATQTYDLDDVLRLREALALAVEAWQPVTPVIAAANLMPSAGPGCDARAVDHWLGSVQSAMNEGVARRAPAPAPAEPDPVLRETTTAVAAAAPPAPRHVPGGDHAAVVQRINDARFTPLRFRHGYVMTEVDDFLDELVAAVSAGERIAARVQEARFTESRMREAYLIEDVEAFLADLVRDHEGVMVSRTVPAS